MNISEESLEQIFSELLDAGCICGMSAVLTTLTDAELEGVYKDFLVQYGQELALGALERSEWFCNNLVINANQPAVYFFHTALDAIRDEIERRKAAVVEGPTSLPN